MTGKDTNPAPKRQDQSVALWITAVFFVLAFTLYAISASDGLDDYDSVNYAFGVLHYDVVHDAPHPPGAPVYVFLAKLAHLFISDVSLALSLTAALGGALLVACWHRIYLHLLPHNTATFATFVLTVTPGLWMTASRPMSDTLAFGLLSATVLFTFRFYRQQHATNLYLAVAALALAVGVRPQLGGFSIIVLLGILFYFRPPFPSLFRALVVFGITNLLWLVPAAYSQMNLDGTGWLTYFNQILRFKGEFAGASGSPLFAENLPLIVWVKKIVGHFGAMLYFGMGMNVWYPESLNVFFASFGSSHTPWNTSIREWTTGGTVYALVSGLGVLLLIKRLLKRHPLTSNQRFIAWVSIAYFFVVVLLVPPHMRFYIPLIPVLIALPFAGFDQFRTRMMFHFLLSVSVLAAALPTVQTAQKISAPPVALVNQVASQTGQDGENAILLFDSNGSRHAAWYLPKAQIYGYHYLQPPEDPRRLFDSGGRVFTNYPNPYPDVLDSVKLATYKRAMRVWMRHTRTELYELKLKSNTANDTHTNEPEPHSQQTHSLRKVQLEKPS